MALKKVFLLQEDTGDGIQALAAFSTPEIAADVRGRLANIRSTQVDEFVVDSPMELLGYAVDIDPDGSVFSIWDRVQPSKTKFIRGSRNHFEGNKITRRTPLSNIYVNAANVAEAKSNAQVVHALLREKLGEITGETFPEEWTDEAVEKVLELYDEMTS